MPKFLFSNTFPFLGGVRVVATVAVMSIAIGACGGAPEPPAEQEPAAEAPAEQPPATPAPTFLSIAPSELLKIYQDNNEYQAEEMAGAYLNRMLEVDAAVLSVSDDPEGIVVVTSTGAEAAPDDPTTMRLLFPKTAEGSVSTLEAGANIHAGCRIQRFDATTLELTECELL